MGMRHEYVSQIDMTHTQAKINQKNEESTSETWRGLDDRDDYEGGEELPWKCKQWNKEASSSERDLVTHVLCQSSSLYSGPARLQSCVKKVSRQ